MSDQTITGKIASLDLTTKQGVDQANLILAPYVHEKASLDLKAAIHQLENEDDPLKRYPLLYDVEEAIKAIANAQRSLGKAIPLEPTPPPAWDDVKKWDESWLIKNWLPTEALTIFYGRGGIGKSFLMLQVACALIEGVPDFFLYPYHGGADELRRGQETQPGVIEGEHTVAIASYEEHIMRSYKRIDDICHWQGHTNRESINTRLKFYEMKSLGPLWGVNTGIHQAIRGGLLDEGRRLLDGIRKLDPKPALLVIDPCAAAYAGNENERSSVRDFARELYSFSEAEGLATLLIAHPSKEGIRQGKENHGSGSTDWEGSCRSLWTLTKEGNPEKANTKNQEVESSTEHYQLSNVKNNYAYGENVYYLSKIRNEEKSKWTPVWEAGSKEEAIDFYQDFNKDRPAKAQKLPKNQQEDTNDEDTNLV